jgi:hypothetical protein
VNWASWLASHQIQTHKTSRTEIENLRALIQRDLKDAGLTQLSADRRFATAYNAALQSATMALACAGYRVTARIGHHKIAFEATVLALGPNTQDFADYFEICRRKRNMIDYTQTYVASETEAIEIVQRAKDFHGFVEDWIRRLYPPLSA